jgi:Tol biopolymer transport system component
VLSDEQFIEQVRAELHAGLEVLKPSQELLDALDELMPDNGRVPHGSVERPAGRDQPRWRRRLRGLGAAVPVLAALIVVVVVAAVALTSLRPHHRSTPTSRNVLGDLGQCSRCIALVDPGHTSNGPGFPGVHQPNTPIDPGAADRLELVNPDGSGRRLAPTYPCSRPQLGEGDCRVGAFAWSSGGRQLAYLAGVWDGLDPSQYTLYLAGADGRVRRLAACGGCQDLSWSPDGSQIAVVRYVGTRYHGAWNVWVINVKAGAMRPITFCAVSSCVDALDLHDVQWSPSGRDILLVRSGHGRALSLDTIHPDGSHPTTITTMPEPTGTGTPRSPFEAAPNPQWSPDGREIAFNEGNGIYTIHADGTGLKRIVALGGNPAWSPDGTRLAYSTLKRVPGGALLGLGTINADGSGNRVLYDRPWARYRWWIDNWGVQVWSPDGRQIAFAAVVRPYKRATWVINADGTGLHQIGANTSTLAWQPTPPTR